MMMICLIFLQKVIVLSILDEVGADSRCVVGAVDSVLPTAGDAACDGMASEMEHFRLDVVLLQGLFDFVQSGVGAASLMEASIDQQGFHASVFSV